MPCHEVAGFVICTPGPTKVYKTEREAPRWCFGCRKRLGGTWTLTGETGLTYYEPNWTYRCDGGDHDRRFGFGYGPL